MINQPLLTINLPIGSFTPAASSLHRARSAVPCASRAAMKRRWRWERRVLQEIRLARSEAKAHRWPWKCPQQAGEKCLEMGKHRKISGVRFFFLDMSILWAREMCQAAKPREIVEITTSKWRSEAPTRWECEVQLTRRGEDLNSLSTTWNQPHLCVFLQVWEAIISDVFLILTSS